MADTGTYTQHPELETLPLLVRQQRRLEAQIVAVAPAVEEEKAVRQQIDQLLVKAAIVPGDAVTCNGYDVMHHLRAGSHRLNQPVLIAQLVARGVDQALVETAIAASTETGAESTWATVKPSKGAKVRR